ncbi:MAG: alpha/beta hydrolase [Rhodospirillales bacterium CG15_BIG_FIL_POST_REV_8_21_14_020_66_15]|nr:MAG: alpha/beta hydrolase [Rhodospirillales bacterium CG15_BIG_FIL_POST_REV_8_21_14_020_66_15]
MPITTADDGTTLYYEDTGSGEPILFLHEYGGDPRSWQPQVEAFSRTNRCVVTACRGYAPSGVPDDPDAYAYDIVAEDARAVLDHLLIGTAHVVGLSMGAYTGLMLALRHHDRVLTLTAASGGSGSHPEDNPGYRTEAQRLADAMEAAGTFPADDFANGPTRLQLKRKDPAAWDKFRRELAEHDVKGAAHVLRRIVGGRPSLYTFRDQLASSSTPVLFMVGDEDEPVLDINLWLKRTMPGAGLEVVPKSGHLLNLEEPAAFNLRIKRFHQWVAEGAWPLRDMATVGFGGVAPAQHRP